MKRIFLFVAILIPYLSLAQFTGRVVDDNGDGIPFASISLKNSNLGTTSDSTGRFSLVIDRPYPFTLVISYVGYVPQELVVRSANVNNVLVQLQALYQRDTVVITSRRRREILQDVPIPVTVVTGGLVSDAGAFNVNRLKELIPSVQLYSSNPRNTTLNVRGQGSAFGLTNDGIDPGVGFYVDGVYYARPAATMFDFIDVERVEVLRGPQGTLYGKNTTAGSFNITTKKPSFRPGGNFELSYGNLGYIQSKASITGALTKRLAGRISFAGTQRNGQLEHVITGKKVNDLNNLGFRGQLLYKPSESVDVLIIGDATTQRPDGYAQVVAGVVTTQRPAYRQFEQIIADLGYDLPSRNPFDRKIDHNTPWQSNNDMGGVSVNVDWKLGGGTLTSTSAWRYWKWGPSNDRDFTGLAVLSLSQAPSKHQQWSQELRYAGNISSRITGVVGLYAIGQELKTNPYHTEESGDAQWRFSKSNTSDKWATPGLFDGYGIRTRSLLETFSGAAFGQIDWEIFDGFHVLVGLRYNYDQKKVDFNRQTYGGLETTDPDLIALKRAVYTDQAFKTNTDNTNLSGLITISYKVARQVNAYATYSTNYKSVGLNLGGLPTNAGEVMLELASIKPEYVRHFEAGVKTTPFPGTTLNITAYTTSIDDYQTQVQTAEVGVNRGYLANAEEVRVRGIEFDGNSRIGKNFTIYGALAFTEGKYISFKNAPVPLEETGGPAAFKDVSGGDLPGISKWSGSLSIEYSKATTVFNKVGQFFIAADGFYRSDFSSSPSPSKYLNVDGYFLLNSRIGFKTNIGLSAFIWGRNILNKDYFEQLLPAAGNAGHYAAVLGDVRTYGITLRYAY
jgi:iron complex outermembrane receptor protein